MDDFFMFGPSFDLCLHHLEVVLKRCVTTSLVLNREKFHFMVREGIVLVIRSLQEALKLIKARWIWLKDCHQPLMPRGLKAFLVMPFFIEDS